MRQSATSFSSGLPETRCGIGSTLKRTIFIRNELPILLEQYNIKTLLDVPCGDWNWMKETNLSKINIYEGWDISPENLIRAMENEPVQAEELRPKVANIFRRNVFEHEIPKRDAILCRDFLQHLPFDKVKEVLKLFKDSGTTYLIATSYMNPRNRDIKQIGDFRPLNLMVNPIKMDDWLTYIPESDWEAQPGSANHHALGIWKIND